jgi:hypothetical protein
MSEPHPLCLAAKRGDRDAVAKIITSRAYDTNALSGAYCEAARAGHLAVLIYLDERFPLLYCCNMNMPIRTSDHDAVTRHIADLYPIDSPIRKQFGSEQVSSGVPVASLNPDSRRK